MNWRLGSIRRVATDVYDGLLPLVTINILWFVLSLTVVFMPPATASLYEIAFRSNKGEGPQVQAFLGAVRRWLVKSWLWSAATLVLVFASVLAFEFYGAQRTAAGDILFAASSVLTIFLWLVQFYFWPYMFFQEESLILPAVRNAAFTVLGDPLFALLNVGVAFALLVLSVLLIAPIALITPAVIAFLGIYSLQEWLDHHDLIQDGGQE